MSRCYHADQRVACTLASQHWKSGPSLKAELANRIQVVPSEGRQHTHGSVQQRNFAEHSKCETINKIFPL